MLARNNLGQTFIRKTYVKKGSLAQTIPSHNNTEMHKAHRNRKGNLIICMLNCANSIQFLADI